MIQPPEHPARHKLIIQAQLNSTIKWIYCRFSAKEREIVPTVGWRSTGECHTLDHTDARVWDISG